MWECQLGGYCSSRLRGTVREHAAWGMVAVGRLRLLLSVVCVKRESHCDKDSAVGTETNKAWF